MGLSQIVTCESHLLWLISRHVGFCLILALTTVGDELGDISFSAALISGSDVETTNAH